MDNPTAAPAPSPPRSPTLRELTFALLALTVAATAAYWPSFSVPFQFDDLEAIVNNPTVHLERLDGPSLARATASSRPLANLSFALNGWLCGPGVLGFHVVNLMIHVLASLFAYVVARRLLEAGRGAPQVSSTHAVALVCALLFALHPVHTQAVTYIVQRMASLGTLFALMSTASWLSAWGSPGPWRWRAAALALWLAACGCKQNFVVLPLVLLAVDALFAPGGARRSRVLVAVAVASAVTVGGAVALAMREVLLAEYGRMGLGPWQTLVEQPRVLVQYLSLLALPLPSRLRVDRLWELSRTLVEWRALAAMATLLGLGALAVASRKRTPLLLFAVVWFFGNLVVEQTLLPVDLYFEHRLYGPSFGWLLLLAVGIDAAAHRLGVGLAVLAAPLLLAAGLATAQRNELWRDPAALHGQAVDAGQGTPRSYGIVGVARLEAGDLAGAEAAFRAGLARSLKDGANLANLGQVAERRGDPGSAEQWYLRAIEDEPSLRQPRVALILLLARVGRGAEANERAAAWVARSPEEPHAWYAQGVALSQQGAHAGAREAFSRAVELDPRFDAAWRDRGASALALGLWPEAAKDFERVVRLRPGTAQAWRELGYAHERGGDLRAAISAYEGALGLEPGQRALAEYVTQLRRNVR